MVEIGNNKIPIKLLIDSGGSDALWLFEDENLGIKSADRYFQDFLGHGLNGSVYGKRSKIESFSLKNFTLKNVNVAFPDSTYTLFARNFKDRNGSLAGNILKRFNIIIDYQRAIITLKKNNHFKYKFSYNKSGIELAHHGFRLVKELDNKSLSKKTAFNKNDEVLKSKKFLINPDYKISLKPAFVIVELRENSPAQKAGLLHGDVVVKVNNFATYKLSLQKLMRIFYGDAGKSVRLKVDRNGELLTFHFKLKDIFN
jgi:hypothetical protein